MKRFIGHLVVVTLMTACQDPTPITDLTGYETTYELVSASAYDVSGTLTLKERKDGFTNIDIVLTGTSGDAHHPVHLHLGNVSTSNAPVAAMLDQVTASTGKSKTVLTMLADETPITYKQLLDMEACIKVHLGDTGPERDVILSAGNIGKSYTASGGRKGGIAVCKSN